ncbi:MAG: flagellar hook-associated protein FlgL [Syntrophomonadaceae bacterium]|nr:flagellar hook-associated protein FlgL [Syntrophomonadaceae bacterium]
MMRVTNKMMVNSLNRNLSSNLSRLDDLQRQISSSRKINKPSDDPAGLVKALRLRTNLVEGEQYLTNIDDSLGFMDTTDSTLNSINEILHSAREKAVKASTDSNAEDDFQAIADEIREMNEQLKLLANATYGSKYIFAGTNVTESPYTASGWLGNNEAIEAEIGVGVTVPINIDAKEFFAGRTDDLSVKSASGINGNKIVVNSLQEGNYQLDTGSGTASEVAGSLQAVSNTGMFFFYDNAGTPAAAGIEGGAAAGSANTAYNGSLKIEVTAVDDASDTLTVNIRGSLAIGSGEYTEINIVGQSMNMAAASGDAVLTITAAQLQAAGLPATATEDMVIWNNSGQTLAGIEAEPASQFATGDTVNIDISSLQSSARESQNYLSAVPNAGSFFYETMGTAATLGAGADNGLTTFDNDAPYSGSLLIETTKVDLANGKIGPQAQLDGVSTAAGATLALSKPLYLKSQITGNLEAITDNTELKDYFNVKRTNGDTVSNAITSAVYDVDTKQITFTFDNNVGNGTDVQAGDTITWNNDWDASSGTTVAESGAGILYDQYGNEFQRVNSEGEENQLMELAFDGSSNSWAYDDIYESSKITVNIKGHLYTGDGTYKYVELENIEIDSETAQGAKIFKISAEDINDPAFTQDLVIWNNGADALGGIDPDTPQLKVGDKTVISLVKQGSDNSQNTEINFSYESADGTVVEGSQNMKFDDATFDYETRELRFFTLNEQTGLDYSGDISLETGVFGAQEEAVTFTWSEGLFSYMEDLARKIEAGEVSETSLELEDSDERMQEILRYRSTVGARVNRLELQQNRLESTQITYTELLSKTEDADMAEVLMQLQLQQNVYQASLAVGAMIIQPSLMDYLG